MGTGDEDDQQIRFLSRSTREPLYRSDRDEQASSGMVTITFSYVLCRGCDDSGIVFQPTRGLLYTVVGFRLGISDIFCTLASYGEPDRTNCYQLGTLFNAKKRGGRSGNGLYGTEFHSTSWYFGGVRYY